MGDARAGEATGVKMDFWRYAGSPWLATLALLAASSGARAVEATRDWPQFGYDAQHSGFNRREDRLGPGNVAGLRMLFRVDLPAPTDGAPVYLEAPADSPDTGPLLFVTTRAGDLVALAAGDGSLAWVRHNPAGDCRINQGDQPCYTTSSPAIDPDRRYVYSYGLDGRVHKYRAASGEEIASLGWPQIATLKPDEEKGSSALAVATTLQGQRFLYVAHSGYLGDRGDYQGHITTINLASGEQTVFNALCSDLTVHLRERPDRPGCPAARAGIWARAGVVYAAGLGRIFATTGNGPFGPSGHNWGDTVLALHPDGTGAGGSPLDSYTPVDQAYLEDDDLDLGSTAPAILPAPAGSTVRHPALQGGKDGRLRLLDLDDLSGQGQPGHLGGEIGPPLAVPQGGMVLAAPAAWVDARDSTTWAFVATAEGLCGLRLEAGEGGEPTLVAAWTHSAGATSPVVANGVLYCAASGSVRALDPRSGRQLWGNGQIGGIHWQSPIVTAATLYICDNEGHLFAFTVP
jgi:outer membrane protein assembly factor BamB